MGKSDSLVRKLTTIQKIDKLGKVDIFSQLGPNELLLLSNQCAEEEFPAGKMIFHEGDPAQEIYILLEGSVELTHGGGQLSLVREGESFGTLSVLGEQPRLFTAIAVETSICLKIDRDSFWDILEDYPVICQGIFKILAQRVSTMVNQASQSPRVPS